jgi:hypothetical protein
VWHSPASRSLELNARRPFRGWDTARCRKLDEYGWPLPQDAFNSYITAAKRDKSLHERKPQACSFVFSRQNGIDPPKRLERERDRFKCSYPSLIQCGTFLRAPQFRRESPAYHHPGALVRIHVGWSATNRVGGPARNHAMPLCKRFRLLAKAIRHNTNINTNNGILRLGSQ